ncbi:MAG: RdgB/HAM1 family non-canonical purine NTP pyrophosphatase [Armatimonadetes bacterium]|nr:RdgB/HAM1 family non-canonical purine NTP pyrophosphatase [Armatimonadota bacterium]
MIERLVLATHNRKKAGEMREVLLAVDAVGQIKTLADYPGAPVPEETGATYSENALIKARSAVEFTGEWCLADDAGLEIDALPGDLGVHSKRYGGDSTFEQKIRLVLERMQSVEDSKRTARFRCCVALVSPQGEHSTFESLCEGRIAREPAGSGGFGYDPIFFLPELRCTLAQLTPEQKHAVSHRGKVLRELAKVLPSLS